MLSLHTLTSYFILIYILLRLLDANLLYYTESLYDKDNTYVCRCCVLLLRKDKFYNFVKFVYSVKCFNLHIL